MLPFNPHFAVDFVMSTELPINVGGIAYEARQKFVANEFRAELRPTGSQLIPHCNE
jgi:hypothetical protein